MSSPTLSRRVFLKGSGGVLAGTLAFAGGPIALLAPSRSWAMPLDTLSTRQGEVLLEVAKQMFPHPGLEDAVYAHVVKSLDAKAEAGDVHTLLHDGIKALDDASGGDCSARTRPRGSRGCRPWRIPPSSRPSAAMRWSRCTTTTWPMPISATAGRRAMSATSTRTRGSTT